MRLPGSRPLLLFAVTAGIIWLLPVIRLVDVSLQGGVSNYGAVLTRNGLWHNLLNSALVAAATIALVIAVASPAAFVFSKLRLRGKTAAYLLLLSGLMLPAAAILVPLSQIVNALHWNNTYQALIMPYAALSAPLALVLLKGAYDSLPDELLEAAAMDGASMGRTWLRVYAPLTAPTVMTVVIWTFLSSWNEFLLALLFMHTPGMQTVTVVPLQFQLQFFVQIPKVFAALVLIELPVVVLYLVFQRRFERGLTAGAVK
jgi:raffinose/stachyose/melibiose transport system permease protein